MFRSRFKKLDTDKSGTLSLQELLELPQIKQNPLARRIVGINNNLSLTSNLYFMFHYFGIDVLDQDSSGEIDFQEFVRGMSQFSSQGDKETKLRFAFRIYDMDNDGFISNGELYQVGWGWVYYLNLNLNALLSVRF